MKRFKWLMLSLFSGSIILILALSEGHTVVYKKGNRLNVLATSLNMWSKPSIKSKKIGRVPYGARVTVLKKTKKTYKSEGIKGHWVKVKYGKRKGYIFDGYLTKLPAPPKDCKSLKHYADSKLGKIGKNHKNVLNDKEGENHIRYWQQYKYNAKIEIHQFYEDRETSLILKNVTTEEVFLIARLCEDFQTGRFRTKKFSTNSKGEVYIEIQDDLMLFLRINNKLNSKVEATYGTYH